MVYVEWSIVTLVVGVCAVWMVPSCAGSVEETTPSTATTTSVSSTTGTGAGGGGGTGTSSGSTGGGGSGGVEVCELGTSKVGGCVLP